MPDTEKCPACGGKTREAIGIERELDRNGEETGRIRPVIKCVTCHDCGRKQTPITPIGNWYYPAAM